MSSPHVGPRESSVLLALISLTEFWAELPTILTWTPGPSVLLYRPNLLGVTSGALHLSSVLQQTPLVTGQHPFMLSSYEQN